MKSEDTTMIVREWQQAANERDVERLLGLSDEDIAICGPRNQSYGHGHQLLVEWLSRAGLTMETKRTFAQGDTVVAGQHGVWKSVETGEVTGEADFATRFVVGDGRVVELARYDGYGGIELALEEAGLSFEDEV